jgi:hypothetical protein
MQITHRMRICTCKLPAHLISQELLVSNFLQLHSAKFTGFHNIDSAQQQSIAVFSLNLDHRIVS